MTSMEPESMPPEDQASEREAPAAGQQPAPPQYRWYHKAGAVLFAAFCLEVGFFLLFFPWSDLAADFGAFRPQWRDYWDNLYVRGAVSGLGVVNLYISFLEILGLRRFAQK